MFMRALSNTIFLIFCLALSGCEDEFINGENVDFEVFQMEIPSNWKSFTGVGYDSRVGGITNGKDTLRYDYGWCFYNFNNETPATHIRTETAIDGKEALIVQPRERGRGLIGMFVQLDSMNSLSIYGRSKKEKTVLRMFETIKFK